MRKISSAINKNEMNETIKWHKQRVDLNLYVNQTESLKSSAKINLIFPKIFKIISQIQTYGAIKCFTKIS